MTNWKKELKDANRELAYTGAKLFVYQDELYIMWDDGKQDYFAGGFYENELLELITEAKYEAKRKFPERGERFIRCVFKSPQSFLNPHTTYLGSERAAIWWVNEKLDHTAFMDGQEQPVLKSIDDVPSVNAMLAKYFDDPDNEQYSVSIEDITEEAVEACAEKFCEFSWPCSLLHVVAKHLAVELDKIQK